MNRTKHLIAVLAACTLASGALLAGCARSDSTSAADRPAAAAGSPVTAGDLPEVVVTASRSHAKRVALSGNPRTTHD